jgi:hypothetical protein
MAKKSKIARNEQRKVIVERYAEKRLELKKALVDPNGTDESREAARTWACRSCPVTHHRFAFVDAMPSMVVPADSSANMAFLVSDSAIWHTGANCRALRSPAGSFLMARE